MGKLWMMEICRTYVPPGADPVLRRLPYPSDQAAVDAIAACRAILEASSGSVGTEWPEIGTVRIVDETGAVVASYNYLDLIDDRAKERSDR